MSGTYSFQDVQATLVGPGAIINLGAGAAVAKEGITLAAAGDRNTMTVGADGEGMHSLHADKSGTVTVRLLKTSPTNAKLSAAYNVQTQDSSLHGQNIITVSNPRVGDLATARQVAFKRKPDLTYAEDADIVEWVFDAVKIDEVRGVFK